MNKITIVVLSFIITACASVPYAQNPKEFIAQFKDVNGEGFVMSKTSEIIPTSLKKSSNRLKKELVPCLNGESITHQTRRSTYSHQVMTTKIKRTSKRSQMTVQIEHPNKPMTLGTIGDPPKHGYYIAMVDLAYVSKNKTRATYYYGNTAKSYAIDPAKKILRGKKGECLFK